MRFCFFKFSNFDYIEERCLVIRINVNIFHQPYSCCMIVYFLLLVPCGLLQPHVTVHIIPTTTIFKKKELWYRSQYRQISKCRSGNGMGTENKWVGGCISRRSSPSLLPGGSGGGSWARCRRRPCGESSCCLAAPTCPAAGSGSWQATPCCSLRTLYGQSTEPSKTVEEWERSCQNTCRIAILRNRNTSDTMPACISRGLRSLMR